MTAAPLRDGTYHPASRRPSLVVSRTSTYGRPRSTASTGARALWFTTIAKATGRTTNTTAKAAAAPASARPHVAAQRPLVASPRAPQHARALDDEHGTRSSRQHRREVVARQAVDRDVADAVDD